MAERAAVFIDGNNWYHSLRGIGMSDLGRLSYPKICTKLAGPAREWVSMRYYVGQVNQAEEAKQYADQRRFISHLEASDPRIRVRLGRLETRFAENAAAAELLTYLGSLTTRIDTGVYKDLIAIGRRHQRVPVKVEKAVDVMLAVEMVAQAERGEYDCAYLLSADGDFTPALEAARALGKKVYASSAAQGARLAAAANSFIRLNSAWFDDCWS
jgi:uncharacterized LabA/DUF88 family protein